MTQNTTKNDKREQCDTKHNALKIYLTRKKFTPYPVFPAHAPVSVSCGVGQKDRSTLNCDTPQLYARSAQGRICHTNIASLMTLYHQTLHTYR